jgi:N-acyl homoserine lactone hydrolase
VKLHAFHGGGERATMSIFDPFHPEVGTIVEIPYFFYLVEHSDGMVLFDTGGHPSLIDAPRDRLGPAADAFELTMKPGDDVVSQLALIDVRPEQITHVVHSHLHYDHSGGVEFFPDAEFYIQRRELEFARNPPVYQRDIYIPDDFEHPVSWREIDGDHDIFGDGKLVLFPTPGHTAGHQSMLVGLDSGPIILVGDAAYLRRNIEERVLPAIVWSPDAMVSSWERLEAMAESTGAGMIFTHDLEWAQNTRVAPDGFYE